MDHTTLFSSMCGRWEGICRTWFEPDILADEAQVSGEITPLLGGRFLRHSYSGTIQGKARHGEELIAFNTVTREFQTAWVDDFHMNYAILFSTGGAVAHGFSVRGDYDTGETTPRWGWRTEYRLPDNNSLTITAYNITPEGVEAKAVELVYRRVGPVR